jgi:5-methylcytosine-specific restriction endonuclease McrA
MPRAPRICAQHPCAHLVRPPKRYCPEHHKQNIGWNKYSSQTAGRTATTEWRTTRLKVLERDAYTCRINGPRCISHATEVDHIVAHYLGGTDEPGNLQAVCRPCHASRTAAQARAARG